MTTESESAYNASKPFMMIVTAIVTWVISFVLFIVGLSFAKPVIIWGHDITVLVSAGISFVITMIELSFNDAVLDDEKDIILLIIGGAAYALGIVVGYVALTYLLDLGNVWLERIASGSLSVIFEVAPERLMIMGLRRLDIKWSQVPRRLFGRFQRGPSRPNQPRRPQNQPKPAQPQNQNRRTVDMSRYQVPQNLQSQRTPKVPRPGHVEGQSAPTADGFPELTDADIAAMMEEE